MAQTFFEGLHVSIFHRFNLENKQCLSAVSYGFHQDTWSEEIDEQRDFSQSPYLIKVRQNLYF